MWGIVLGVQPRFLTCKRFALASCQIPIHDLCLKSLNLDTTTWPGVNLNMSKSCPSKPLCAFPTVAEDSAARVSLQKKGHLWTSFWWDRISLTLRDVYWCWWCSSTHLKQNWVWNDFFYSIFTIDVAIIPGTEYAKKYWLTDTVNSGSVETLQ